MHRYFALFFAVSFGAVAGCGSGNPWDTVKVSGKVTYEDGTLIPVGSMRLIFAPQTPPVDSKTFPRQGSASVNVADGTFSDVTTYKFADGLIPGMHKVVIVAYESGRNLSPKIPKEFTSMATTPLEIDTAKIPLEITVPKPKAGR